jgi:APA family basic amino acid/polyamine antiporter
LYCVGVFCSTEATPYGSWLPILLTLGAIASLTTVAITILLAQSRVFYAMAYDGLLPPIFARIYHRAHTPWVSITICGEYSINHST